MWLCISPFYSSAPLPLSYPEIISPDYPLNNQEPKVISSPGSPWTPRIGLLKLVSYQSPSAKHCEAIAPDYRQYCPTSKQALNYSPSDCFQTFPFPHSTPTQRDALDRIGEG